MTNTAYKLATYEDLLSVPDTLVAEIIHGVLHTHPRPAPKHAWASSSLGFEVGSPYGKDSGDPGGWWILDEPECHFGDGIFVPDLAGWRKERMPKLPETAWFELVPDWVCEVLSPSTARLDRAEKMPLYASYGVEFIWLIDPELKILEAYKNINEQWVLLKTLVNNKDVSLEPFDAISFPLGNLWG